MIYLNHSKQCGYYVIKQILPAPTGMQAVFKEDDGTIFKSDVHILAVVETYDIPNRPGEHQFIFDDEELEGYPKGTEILPMTGDESGVFECEAGYPDFVRYEFKNG